MLIPPPPKSDPADLAVAATELRRAARDADKQAHDCEYLKMSGVDSWRRLAAQLDAVADWLDAVARDLT